MKPIVCVLALLMLAQLFGCESSSIHYNPPADSDADSDHASDGDTSDGDTLDGDMPDGDAIDGDRLIPPDADVDGDLPTDGDSTMDPCTPDSYRCKDESLILRCSAAGKWVWYRECPEGQVCDAGVCIASSERICEPGDKRCADSSHVEVCDNSGLTWVDQWECREGLTCENAACVIDCTPGDLRCTGDSVQRCTDDGRTWEWAQDCNDGTQCVDGYCAPLGDNGCNNDADCEPGNYCWLTPFGDTSVCLPDCNRDDYHCPMYYVCEDDPDSMNHGRCILPEGSCLPCTADSDCREGFFCEITAPHAKGDCQPLCTENSDCPGELNCVGQRCVVGDGNGDCDDNCPEGYLCYAPYNECVLNCPDCGPNECCDSSSTPHCYMCNCSNPIVCGVGMTPCCYGFTCTACTYGVVGYCL